MIVLSPEGKVQTSGERVAALARLTDLRGKVIGLLDNSKPNADKLGERFEQLLRERFGVSGMVKRRKITAQEAAPKRSWTSLPPRRILLSAGWEIEDRARRGVSTTPLRSKSAADSRSR